MWYLTKKENKERRRKEFDIKLKRGKGAIKITWQGCDSGN